MSEPVSPPAPKRERLPSIDILRGFVMAIMALDHVRDYFHIDRVGITLMDPDQSRPELMVTRWFAQLCAPAFFLLAGMGVFLSLSGGKPKKTVARFLVSRGLFLILLDLTLVRLAWDFNFRYDDGLWFIVLTCLGASMILLAGLVYLPNFWVLVVSVVIIGGCNLLDPRPEANAPVEIKTPEDPLEEEVREDLEIQNPEVGWGRWDSLRILLHDRDGDTVLGVKFYVTYSLFPWLGIMALGFGLGPILKMEASRRRRYMFFIGLGFFLGFAILRALRLYGDPRPWDPNPENPLTYLAFFRTKKYPASFQHVLMTLAPLLMALALLDRIKTPNRIGRWFVQFGRAPLFFYLLHIYVLHGLVVLLGWAQGYRPAEMLEFYKHLPETFGLGLPGVFVIWLVVLGICFPICAWFDRVKRRSKSIWLTYF